jgi:glycerol-3-phosphate acyltransferase PlsY
MMRRLLWLAMVAGAYLLGSLPFSYLIVRRLTGLDVRHLGSGNPGATNALRVAGPVAGAVTLLGDVGKGALATALPRLAGAPQPVSAAAAVAVTAGHVFPAFLHLRGGKGTATAFGALVTLAPGAAAASVGIFAVLAGTTRYVSLGSVGAAAAFPLLVAHRALRRRGREPELFVAAVAIAALVVARHRSNLSRLRAGAERKLGEERGERAPRRERPAAGGDAAAEPAEEAP